ncbi:SdpI family protein [Bacillus sp. SG-1]|uniref:SdpI family protein n=1 Tax=Bacillus sp. SG-1 TaxID=161544 RepID=UPI00015434BD|nr:SdpI family protein [Bacillus sp. SG-1]EDL66317.1 hypothetical protein BSG1_03155 [Bacillus sp. SG-1]
MNIFVGLMLIGLAILFIGLAIPLYLGRISMDSWYGVRLPRSFESEEAWYQINKFGAKVMMVWAIPQLFLGIIVLFLPPLREPWTIILVFSPVFFLFAAFIQSYIYSEKVKL